VTVFVTGAAGYIGSAICRKLRASGEQFVTLDVRPMKATGSHVEHYRADLNGKISLRELMISHQVDRVIHLAGLKNVAASQNQRLQYWDTNVNGTARLLKHCDYGQRHVVFASSAAVYGDQGAAVMETAERRPMSFYATTKVAGEDLLEAWAHTIPEEFSPRWATSLRLFNVFGGRDDEGTVAKIREAAKDWSTFTINGYDYPTRDGTPVRDWVHVDDVADAFITALDRDADERYEAINIGSGVGESMQELADRHEVAWKLGPRRCGDIPISVADVRKAERLLGWAV